MDNQAPAATVAIEKPPAPAANGAPPPTSDPLREQIELLKLQLQGPNPEFAEAFARAQAKFAAIPRTKQVTVTPRDPSKRAYSFAYAPLDVILTAIVPALTSEGFSLTQRIGRGSQGDYIETSLLHKSGERKNQVPIFVTEHSAQQYASGVTYARRYGITLLCCLAAEDDDDGNHADGNQATAREKGPSKAGKSAESRRELDPGQTSHGPVAGMRPAFELPRVAGPERKIAPAPGAQLDFVEPGQGAPPTEPTGEAMTLAEGKIADAIQEFHEAALEGRRVGIEQIWAEIKGDEFVATQTWHRLKEQHPDSFATVQEVLRPKDKKPRGAKK